ncbi:hypothetical protein AT5G24575 [Arabidopsis thaliana]|nr:uncharacterized protein AT5G24575 [Arabidopsis thaliana]ANM68493.1 hypothetical protein AT5G24575 [Arabidopsis thaliana]|eukprot:NP_001336531.1 hypothetical protein AT5G24575 [Arabidopsis thaliana]
MPSHKR